MDLKGGPLMISRGANDKSVARCHPTQEADLIALALDQWSWFLLVYFYSGGKKKGKKITWKPKPKYKVSQYLSIYLSIHRLGRGEQVTIKNGEVCIHFHIDCDFFLELLLLVSAAHKM